MTKICTRKWCEMKGQPQPIENFGKRTATKDGLNQACKTCIRTEWKRHIHPTKQEFIPYNNKRGDRY